MICFNAKIDNEVASYLREHINSLSSISEANIFLENKCGVKNFFTEESDLKELKNNLLSLSSLVNEPDRREYGDFQTNNTLAKKVVEHIKSKGQNPEFVLEPTCGQGSFILACLKQFSSIKKLIGIEIYKPYVWESKFKVLNFYLQNNELKPPSIEIIHADIFEYPIEELIEEISNNKILVIGNPPWVTNSELGSIGSKNLPEKSNFKKVSGLDAITGKGNFDIGEFISLLILRNFSNINGAFSFLIKNSVVKNIVHDQRDNRFRIAEIEKLNIDSKKEFDVSVNACLFFCKMNCEPEKTCKEIDFYTLDKKTTFGWQESKFVYCTNKYERVSQFDGESPFVWRQGLKHDCSKVMELTKTNGSLTNGFRNNVEVENDLLFGLLKSSDLKSEKVNSVRKFTIVTQRKVGQDTGYIKNDFPKTYQYLLSNKRFFDKRKSTIYKGKPPFSIFGIGDYSFKPYKVAISGLYKTTHFTLVYPIDGKPVMLDDTCYFIGFNKLINAKISHALLNNKVTQDLIESIIFPDSKRSITKDVLMRIDLLKILESIKTSSIKDLYQDISDEDLNHFQSKMREIKGAPQMALFGD